MVLFNAIKTRLDGSEPKLQRLLEALDGPGDRRRAILYSEA